MNYSQIEKFLSTGNVVTKNILQSLFPVKLTGFLTQASTTAPTLAVAGNTFDKLPVLARTDVGVYTATLANGFTAGKTVLPVDTTRVKFERTSANVITITTFAIDGTTPADAVLTSYPFSIEVWK